MPAPDVLDAIKYVPSKRVPISKILFDENNPNKMTDAQVVGLEKFMKTKGFAVEVWLNELSDGNYSVIDGEHRIRILIKNGIKHVHAKIFKVSYTEVRMMRQIANKLSGEHDKKQDALEFKEIYDKNKLQSFAEFLGQPIEEFEKILEKNFDITFEKPEEAEVPAPPQNPKTKLKQLYFLGPHRLLCGDALNSEHITMLLSDTEPAMTYTDPPYGLGGYAGRSGNFDPIKGDEQDPLKFYGAIPSTKERYIWGTWQILRDMKLDPRDVIVWKKNNFGMGKGYRNQYEICMYFGSFAGSDSDVWEEAKDAVTEYNHPTQKPVALATRAIKNSTKKGDSVLDLYGGSGSTLIACEATNRVCYMMELDPAYCDVIVRRWENYTGKKAVLQ